MNQRRAHSRHRKQRLAHDQRRRQAEHAIAQALDCVVAAGVSLAATSRAVDLDDQPRARREVWTGGRPERLQRVHE